MTIRATLFVIACILSTCVESFLSSCSLKSSGRDVTVSVLEYHNSHRRDGVYVDATLTKASVATLPHRPHI
jgi:hypothetical protein